MTSVISYSIDELEYHIGNKTFKINPAGHTKKVKDQIISILEEFETELAKTPTETRQMKLVEKKSREILKIGLVEFSDDQYDTLVNDPAIGDVILRRVSQDLQVIFLVIGGIPGWKDLEERQSQTLSDTDTPKDSTGLD